MGQAQDFAEFGDWLSLNVDLSDRSRRDVISRIRRAASMVSVNSAKSDAELVFKLEEKREFAALSATVRSQLRRAARLYHQFLEQKARRPRPMARK